MANQLNENIQNSLHENLWTAIIEGDKNKIEAAITERNNSDLVVKVVREYCQNATSESLAQAKWTAKEVHSREVAEFILMLIAFSQNEQFKEYCNEIEPVLIKGLQLASKNVYDSGDWLSAASLASWLGIIKIYFEEQGNDVATYNILYENGRLTCKYMGHYPAVVCRAMIASAEYAEKLGYTEKAQAFYKAVILDFDSIVEYNFNSMEEGMFDEERDALPFIKAAYIAINRLEATSQYDERIEQTYILINS